MGIRDDNSGRANEIKCQAKRLQRLQAKNCIGMVRRYEWTELTWPKSHLAVYRTTALSDAVRLGHFHFQTHIHRGLRQHPGGKQVSLATGTGYNNVRNFFLKDHAGLTFQ